MNPHYPAGLVPMMLPQQVGQQYMMAVRLPSAGLAAQPTPHAQPMLAAGVQGVQSLQVRNLSNLFS